MAKKKIIVYAKPEIGQEEFTRHIFSICSKELGYEILNIQKAFPDCTAIDLERNKIVQIELEYEAGNFIAHGHDKQMDKDKEYIVICWNNNGADLVRSLGVDVIVLKEEERLNIEIAEPPEIKENQIEKPLYKIISYNRKIAYGKEFSEFENVKMFRTNVRLGKYLPKGSVIVLYENPWLIGEFTVVSYHYLEKKPETSYEKELYSLLSYPVTLSADPVKDCTKCHINFTAFKMYDPPVDLFRVLKRKMTRNGFLKLTYEEYQKIRGQRR